MSFPLLAFWVAVTFKNSDWSGEHVNWQKRLKKFALQAGQEAMMLSALLRFDDRESS
jgi:hypothetical protein